MHLPKQLLLTLMIILGVFSSSLSTMAHASGLTDAERAELNALLNDTKALLQKHETTLNEGNERINAQADRVNASFDTLNQQLKENNAKGQERLRQNH